MPVAETHTASDQAPTLYEKLEAQADTFPPHLAQPSSSIRRLIESPRISTLGSVEPSQGVSKIAVVKDEVALYVTASSEKLALSHRVNVISSSAALRGTTFFAEAQSLGLLGAWHRCSGASPTHSWLLLYCGRAFTVHAWRSHTSPECRSPQGK